MVYIDIVITGLLIFPFIAALFTFPYAIFQYNRYGSISRYRTLIIYSFILYMLIAFFMVSLPLPDLESTVGNTWQDHLNLIPLRQIWLYWHDKPLNADSFRTYLSSMALWQLLFNILLTVPFGVYMRYYFKYSLKRTIISSFLLSLFYEISQITALFGIYPGPYRLADVEDLICNTLGGILGYYIAAVFALVLPSRDAIDRRSLACSGRITGMRRFFSVLFDYIFITLVYIFLLGVVQILYPQFFEFYIYGIIYNWSFFCLVSLIQVLLTKGSTLGHAVCRMTLVSENLEAASSWQLIKRYLFLWLFTELPLIIIGWLMNRQIVIINNFVMSLLMLGSRAYFLYYFYNALFKKGQPMPHDRLSRTFYAATRIPEK